MGRLISRESWPTCLARVSDEKEIEGDFAVFLSGRPGDEISPKPQIASFRVEAENFDRPAYLFLQFHQLFCFQTLSLCISSILVVLFEMHSIFGDRTERELDLGTRADPLFQSPLVTVFPLEKRSSRKPFSSDGKRFQFSRSLIPDERLSEGFRL
jgi:hypothetical protein